MILPRTVRTNRLTATATDQEIETFIKKWLHLSSDRDGGRRESKKRRRSQDTCLQDCQMGPVKEVDFFNFGWLWM
ncbi:hypothetical protein F2P79_005971 [Pimephales promelas]|nr:hypothetical protein F2P79_005971 [Pimephales promelas]